MATVPLSGTNIRLLSGVPFSNDYKHTRWFTDTTAQTNYFIGKPLVHNMTQANFQRIEGKHFIAVNKSIDELWGTNYLMFQNATYNNKWFYGFVTKLEYVQKNTTYVHFQIDVLQTWRFNYTLHPSFVAREHCQLWHEDGSPVVNTQEEGLAYGLEYDNVKVTTYKPYEGIRFMVIISKTPLESTAEPNTIEGSIAGVPQPLSVYVVPFDINYTNPVNVRFNLQSDAPLTNPQALLRELYKMPEAVNNIVGIYFTEATGLNLTVERTNPIMVSLAEGSDQTASVKTIGAENNIYVLKITKKTFFSPMIETVETNKYAGFRSVKESKLLMYPYCVTILDDLKGNRVEIKNEFISGQALRVALEGSLGTSNHTRYSLPDYNATATTTNNTAIATEASLVNSNPTDVPIINDMLAAFLQGNKNSIQNQRNSVLFNGVMNAVGNTTAGVASGVTGNAPGVVTSAVNLTQGAGNTVLQLQGIEAKQQDIGNMPPQIAKMGANTSFDFGTGRHGLYIIKKQIKKEYQNTLEDFFNMYGYKVNRVKKPNYVTRKYWNYIQTVGCHITGNLNNEDLQELKNIFDGGITLWHTEDVGNYSLENEVVTT